MLGNLLDEGLIGVRLRSESREALSLPAVLAALGADAVEAFTALQPHQQHAWYAFLVQLAAIAAHRAGSTDGLADEATWRGRLRELVGGDDAAWCLVVEALERPAFFQPPVPEGSLEGWIAKPFPDGIDVLVTARNHDVKRARIRHPRLEHWVYALVSGQTQNGYGGRDNYGIARMNGGYGNRPCFAVEESVRWGPRFIRATATLLRERSTLVEEYGYQPEGGHALLGVVPWRGKSALHVGECDPFFIEVCRRVRLRTGSAGYVEARQTGSVSPRVAVGESKGDLGDAWTPVRRTDGAALSVGANGFSYQLLTELLLSNAWARTSLQRPKPGAADSMVRCFAVTRGQGKTDGLHARSFPMPARIVRLLCRSSERDALAARAMERVQVTANADQKVLRAALRALLGAGNTGGHAVKSEHLRPWSHAFDRRVDAVFFPRLWQDADCEPQEANARWQRELRTMAETTLAEAIRSVPVPAVRRYRAIVAAEGVLFARICSVLPLSVTDTAKETEDV